MALVPHTAVSSSTHAEAARPRLSAIDALLKPNQMRSFADWVYEQQVSDGGFRGSDSLDAPPGSPQPAHSPAQATHATQTPLVPANLIQSYAALLILAILDDNFQRLDLLGLIRFIGSCQTDDGSFKQYPSCSEPGDPRSTYSAFVIASMLDDWSTINVEMALSFIESCQRPEGGFAIRPFAEPQGELSKDLPAVANELTPSIAVQPGGFTYCSIACYALSNKLDRLPNRKRHLRWLVDRQLEPPDESESDNEDDNDTETDEKTRHFEMITETRAGFQGRAGKTTDACYSFWCLAAIRLLTGSTDLVDVERNTAWLLSCQHETYGGIAREPGAIPGTMLYTFAPSRWSTNVYPFFGFFGTGRWRIQKTYTILT
ncbi:geranylgeranyl transferase type-1 subunit beta [Microbotryomycetes sp. JL201]|nr:geranylgeranyl transferase type-1 subunit beta [Microbotryomycetes sp. JL201]